MPNAEIYQGRGSYDLLDRDLAGKKLLNVISPDSSDVTLIIRPVHAMYILWCDARKSLELWKILRLRSMIVICHEMTISHITSVQV